MTERITPLLRRAVCIGGLLPDECFGYHPIRDKILKMLTEHPLTSNPNMKIWLHHQTETLCKVRDKAIIDASGGTKDVPVLIVIYSEVKPINYVASCSTQVQQRSFVDFEERSVNWIEILPRINALQMTRSPLQFTFGSTATTVRLSFEFDILPMRRPSQIKYLAPDPVEYVSIRYKNISIVASKKSEVDAQIEAEEELREEDREEIISLLRAEKKKEQQVNETFADEEKTRYSDMIDAIATSNGMDRSTVETKLEEMKVFKIYPSSIPPPVITWAGTKGFIHDEMVNRFIGNADKIF